MVVAIFLLAVAVVLPSVSNIGLAELRSTSSKLGGFVKRTYDDAALTGQTHRMVFDFESKVVKVEATDQVLNFEADSNVLAEASRAKDDLNSLMQIPPELQETLAQDDDVEEVDGGELPVGALAAMFSVNQLADMGGMADEEAFKEGEDTLNLGDDVQLTDVWVQGMSEPATKGKVYLHFFPHGYTQDALIHLEDEDGHVFTVKVHALTGKVSIAGEYIEAPK